MQNDCSMPLKTDGSERISYSDDIYPIFRERTSLGDSRHPYVPPHWHDDLELSIVIEGSMCTVVNGVRHVLRKGDCVFINARQLHLDVPHEGSLCLYDTVIFHPSILTGANPSLDACVRRITAHPGYPCAVFRADQPNDRAVIDQASLLFLRMSGPKPTRMLGTVAAACELLFLLAPRLPEETVTHREDKHLSTVRLMTGFIQEHYTERITLYDISRAGLVSERTASTLFKKWFSVTPQVFLLHYRLEKALNLLENTDTPITDIALDTGFSDANYFTVCFRKQFRMTPTEYRARHLAQNTKET